MIHMQIGERIEKIRIEHKLSKAQFGRVLGVTGQYIGKIERNQNKTSVDIIVNICKSMNVSADYVLFGKISPLLATSTCKELEGLSQEQIEIALDIVKKVAQFINTDNGNEVLIQEVMRQLQNNIKGIDS